MAPTATPVTPTTTDGSRATPIAIGEAAPMTGVEMQNVDGERLTIGRVRGEKGTLVVFTCNHCPWAKAWHDRLTTLGNQYAAQGIGVIAINSNDPAEHEDDGFEAMQARARETGMRFPYVVDATSDVARAYGATKTPEVFLFDRELKLAYYGAIDDNAHEEQNVAQRYLRDALEAVVNGSPVPVSQTRALGCSIKFRGRAS
jgi:peroxiredoxin